VIKNLVLQDKRDTYVTPVAEELQQMFKMMTLHCHTSFGPRIHGLMDALDNASSAAH
jgi:hypothetical protein